MIETGGSSLKTVEYDDYEIDLGALGVRSVRIVGKADRLMDGCIEVVITNVFCGSSDIFPLVPIDQYDIMKARLTLAFIESSRPAV